jgi:hypothetical protein
MAAPTNAAKPKKALANSTPSTQAQTGGWRSGRACPLCPDISDINLFSYGQSIIYFDA